MKSRLLEEKKKMLETKPDYEIDVIENVRIGDIKQKSSKNEIFPKESLREDQKKVEDLLTTLKTMK